MILLERDSLFALAEAFGDADTLSLACNATGSALLFSDYETYCIYDAPTPEAIRTVAKRNGLPVDRIAEVAVLDPYFHRP